jgi:hypothetical protein
MRRSRNLPFGRCHASNECGNAVWRYNPQRELTGSVQRRGMFAATNFPGWHLLRKAKQPI